MTADEQRGLSKDFRRIGLVDLFDDVRRAVNSLRKEIDLGDFGRLQDDFTTADVGGWKVNMDYADKGDHLELSVDVPGMTRDDLEVEVYENYLVVRGERHLEHEEKRDDYMRTERFTGKFVRRVPLTPDIDAEGVTAELDDGVLSVTIPKSGEGGTRKVQIH